MNGRVAKRIDGLAARAGYSVGQTRTLRRMYNGLGGRDRGRLLGELEELAVEGDGRRKEAEKVRNGGAVR